MTIVPEYLGVFLSVTLVCPFFNGRNHVNQNKLVLVYWLVFFVTLNVHYIWTLFGIFTRNMDLNQIIAYTTGTTIFVGFETITISAFLSRKKQIKFILTNRRLDEMLKENFRSSDSSSSPSSLVVYHKRDIYEYFITISFLTFTVVFDYITYYGGVKSMDNYFETIVNYTVQVLVMSVTSIYIRSETLDMKGRFIRLAEILDLSISDDSIKDPVMIRKLFFVYDELCQQLLRINEIFGVRLLFFVIVNFQIIFMKFYIIIVMLNYRQPFDRGTIADNFVQVFGYLIQFIYLIAVFENTKSAVKRVNTLLRNTIRKYYGFVS